MTHTSRYELRVTVVSGARQHLLDIKLRYAIYVPSFGTFDHAQAIAELARDAEAAGWDRLSIGDHLFADTDAQGGPIADPRTCLAAIAVQTRLMRLGAHMPPFARRRLGKLARERVTLDDLSNGRLIVGAGIGDYGWREYSAFGGTANNVMHAAMLDQRLNVVNGL